MHKKRQYTAFNNNSLGSLIDYAQQGGPHSRRLNDAQYSTCSSVKHMNADYTHHDARFQTPAITCKGHQNHPHKTQVCRTCTHTKTTLETHTPRRNSENKEASDDVRLTYPRTGDPPPRKSKQKGAHAIYNT